MALQDDLEQPFELWDEDEDCEEEDFFWPADFYDLFDISEAFDLCRPGNESLNALSSAWSSA